MSPTTSSFVFIEIENTSTHQLTNTLAVMRIWGKLLSSHLQSRQCIRCRRVHISDASMLLVPMLGMRCCVFCFSPRLDDVRWIMDRAREPASERSVFHHLVSTAFSITVETAHDCYSEQLQILMSMSRLALARHMLFLLPGH